MSKNFDDLTIVDDYMFCTVLQDDTLCMQLLDMVLKHKIHKISKIIHQKTIDNTIASKSIRLDIMIEDDSGKLYDVEMLFSDRLPCLRKTPSFAFRKTSLLLGTTAILGGTDTIRIFRSSMDAAIMKQKKMK